MKASILQDILTNLKSLYFYQRRNRSVISFVHYSTVHPFVLVHSILNSLIHLSSHVSISLCMYLFLYSFHYFIHPLLYVLIHFIQPDDYEELIIDVHKAKVGYTPTQAESEFLQIAKKLPRYGMHLFAVKVYPFSRIFIHFCCYSSFIFCYFSLLFVIYW